jgi:peptidoglycan hydrolase FlgJ
VINTMNSLAIDAGGLEQLKTEAGRDPKGAARKAATQFEAMFLQMVLKSMRDATPQSELSSDSSQQTYTSMLDAQIAQKMAGKGVGLADALVKQLTRQMGTIKPETASGGLDGKTVIGKSDPSGPSIALTARTAGQPRATVDMDPNLVSKGTKKLSANQAAFVQKMWEPAAAAERSTGVPASFIIGQAALETGWGKREIRDGEGKPSFNLFGIKASTTWTGPTVSTLTTEYLDHGRVKIVDKFRAYGSYQAAFEDWAKLMSNSPRYGQVLKAGGSIHEFANGLQKAGYATDPAYASKLTRVIEQTLSLRGALT